MGLVRFLVTLKIDRLLHILVRLNEIKVRLAHVQVINISELLLPHDLIVVECTLLLIRVQMQAEQRLYSLQKFLQGLHVELGGRLVHPFVIRIVLVLIPRVRPRVNCFRLNKHISNLRMAVKSQHLLRLPRFQRECSFQRPSGKAPR